MQSKVIPFAPQERSKWKALPRALEIELLAENRDYKTPGGAYVEGAEGTVPLLVLCVNLVHPSVRAAIAARDARTMSWILGLCLAEMLLLRRKHSPDTALKNSLLGSFLPPGVHPAGFLSLAETLAIHHRVQAIGTLLASGTVPPGQRVKLEALAL